MPVRFTVRPVRIADLDRIMVIERACFGRSAYDRNLFADYCNKCRQLFLVAERGARVCGYALASMRGDAAELVSIAVDPAVRRKGAASALMASVLRRIERRGAARLGLTVRTGNRGAQRFYEGYGFQKTRRIPRYYEDGADGWRMMKRLSYRPHPPDASKEA
jgi:[ribosomal protein S18]-alanine N-acetyltransferase